jgi:hypothetical protein
MRRTRQVLVLTLLATALCVDRAAAAAPALRPPVGQIARQLADRLTTTFRRTVAQVRFRPVLREGQALATADEPLTQVVASPLHQDFAPFQFRLPPPLA